VVHRGSSGRASLCWITLAFTSWLWACNGDSPTNPSAGFSTQPTGTGISGVSVFTFAAAPSDSSLVYSWDFGDGASGSGDVVTHVYAREGTFRVATEPDLGRPVPGPGRRGLGLGCSPQRKRSEGAQEQAAGEGWCHGRRLLQKAWTPARGSWSGLCPMPTAGGPGAE